MVQFQPTSGWSVRGMIDYLNMLIPFLHRLPGSVGVLPSSCKFHSPT